MATAAFLLAPVVEARATTPADLCTGDPCNVTADVVVDAGSDLDFGPAALVIKRNVTISVAPAPTGTPLSLTLRAASITFEPKARIDAPGATIRLITTVGDFVMQSAGIARSRILVQENSAGTIDIQTAANAIVGGILDADGTGGDALGGSISITAGGRFENTEAITAGATGSFSEGGDVSITATGDARVGATLDLSAGGSDGGFVDITSTDGDIHVDAPIETGGGDPDGSGGSVDLTATKGSVFSTARIRGRGGTGVDFDCGDGADVTISAGVDVILGAPVDAKGGFQCFGGGIDIDAGRDFVQQPGADLFAFGPGGEGGGGDLVIVAARNATLDVIDAGSGGFGGTIDVVALGSLVANGLISTKATATSFSTGGTVSLQACDLTIAGTSTVDSRSTFNFAGFGVNSIRSGGPMLVEGTLRASDRNELRYKTVLPIVTGTADPAPVVVEDPTLPECATIAFCGDGNLDQGEACDDGNTASCDGCRADCSRPDAVCGDGIVECGEACDDGNTVGGDGCEPDCTLPGVAGAQLVGFPRQSAGCLLEWKVRVREPKIRSGGFPAPTQECLDGDPLCDEDLSIDGDCEVQVQACARVADPRLPSCSPAAIASFLIKRPKPGAGSDPYDLANADALRDALLAFGANVSVAGSSTPLQVGTPLAGMDVCTDPFIVKAPHRELRPLSRTIKVGATDANGLEMLRNRAKIRCLPNPAVCGNGDLEIGESCDDGNTSSCDGCSATCKIEACGNGIVECDEECDEGPLNGTEGVLCSSTCQALAPPLRIAGGGPRAKDCAWQWSMLTDPANVAVDRKGLPRNRQDCRDDDPSCDFDPTAGNCRFRLWACVGEGRSDLGCSATRVNTASILRPRSNSRFAHERTARSALTQAVMSLGLPAGPATASGEECTPFEVDLPAGKRRLTLRVKAFADSGKDADSLTLRCLPK